MSHLPPFATAADVEAELGRALDSARDVQRVEWLLDKASLLIRSETGATWVDDDNELDGSASDEPAQALDTFQHVATSVVARCVRNPTGVTEEAAGPFSQSFEENASGVYLTKTELAMLAAVVTSAGSVGGLRTVSTTRGPVETPNVTCRSLGEDAAAVLE
jgi:hypothetical protein